jgi:hypothetical protein
MTDDQVVTAMEVFGGSFIRALALAYRAADRVNQARLKAAFPDEWVRYHELAVLKGGRPS